MSRYLSSLQWGPSLTMLMQARISFHRSLSWCSGLALRHVGRRAGEAAFCGNPVQLC